MSPAGLVSRTASLLALAALLAAAPGAWDRALPLDCALPQGELRCDQPCALRCTSAASWSGHPYLTFDADGDGAAFLRWSAGQAIELEPGVPADAGARWEGPIVSAELLLAGTWHVRAVTLHTRLPPLARLRLALRELLAPEPFAASSNNTTPPRWVLGSSLLAFTGLASLLAMLALLWRTRRAAGSESAAPRALASRTPRLFAVLLAGFLLVTGGPLASLAAHAAHATSHSALQGPLRDEEAARWGEPFAALAEALRARVPPGALVLFPRDLEHARESEAHWMDFHFWPAYRSVPSDGGAPGYVFWYRPLLLRRAPGAILDAGGATLLRVEPLVELDDGRAIFKVLR